MTIKQVKVRHTILDISPEKIHKNPENPRLLFRQEEIDTLLLSIKKYGIQVPITVYEDEDGYVLIDGERRWRCANKLNLKKIPALVQPKPSQLENLLLMYNIHALREQWDYLTIAKKLPDIIKLFFFENGHEPNEIELSEATGLTRGQIRRCRLLLDLPEKYRSVLFEELDLPKSKQRLSEDFFIEMERSLKTVSKRLPALIESMDDVRDVLIDKYRKKVINNVVDLRKISKIATSISSLGIPKERANKALSDIFRKNQVSITEVFSTEFESRLDEKRLIKNLEGIFNYIEDIELDDSLDEQPNEARALLIQINLKLNKLLGS